MKPIVLTDEAKQNALEIFKQMLNEVDGGDLKINITTETLLLKQGIAKHTIFITAIAYSKIIALINSSNKELAWYGTASRVMNNYLIEDVYVYPQTVTSATVDADEEKCAKWLMELPDEVINKLCFQGHSHVTMSASPSGRDTGNWQKFANLLKPGEFYILCIGNQRNEFYWNIYDTACNVHFENKDIEYCVIDDKGNSIKEWATESIEKYIKPEAPVITTGFTMPTYQRAGFSAQNNTPRIHATTLREDVLKKSDDKSVVDALKIIPKEYKALVDYDPDSDIYYTEEAALPGFSYSTLYQSYIIAGYKFREKYNGVKNKVGRPKKENKNN